MVNTNKVPLRRIEGINNYKTNCITEIPQDIKLELADGVLTLKAGSKVYMPNGKNEDGSNKFDEIVVENDIIVDTATSSTATYKSRIHYREDKACYCNMMVSNSTSGSDNNPIINHGMYYNVTLNKIFYYSKDGIAIEKLFSFPLGDVTVSNGVVTSIDNICNGFGYIGSTLFALPNVKGLIPNGRNEDGSLNNIESSVSNVSTVTFPTTITSANHKNGIYIGIGINGDIGANGAYTYDEEKHLQYNEENIWNRFVIGKCEVEYGKIISFNPNVFGTP